MAMALMCSDGSNDEGFRRVRVRRGSRKRTIPQLLASHGERGEVVGRAGERSEHDGREFDAG